MKSLILIAAILFVSCTKSEPEQRIKGWSRVEVRESTKIYTKMSITIAPYTDVDSIVLYKDGMTFRKTVSPYQYNDFTEDVRLRDQEGHVYQFKVYSPSGIDATREF